MRRSSTTWKRWSFLALVSLALVSAAVPGVAQDSDTDASSATATPQFGGPGSVQGQLDDDAKRRGSLAGDLAPKGYFAWKDRLAENYGLSFSLDYTTALMGANNTIADENFFASGAARFFGAWSPFGRESGNTGTFVWKVEHRHGYTNVPASGTASQIGYVGLIMPVLSDIESRMTNLYWKQNVAKGRVELVAGFLDVTDWVDLYALASPWVGFFNFGLATGSAAIPVPDDSTIGAYVNAMLTDNFYVIGGLSDSNANSTDPFNGFDTFFNNNEYFTSLELGWTSSQERFYLDNTHLTYWHVDERVNADVPSGWGLNFSTARAVGVKWTPYLRAGYTEDGGSLVQKSISAGVGYHLEDDISLFGAGVNWNEPNETTFGSGLDDQFSTEVFCRIQVAKRLQVTPMLEWVINPALNPTADQSWVYGIRARLYL